MLLDLLFPRQSLTGSEGEWITEEEFGLLTASPRVFERTELERRGLRHLDRLFAVSSYRDCPLLKKAIHTFKYHRIPVLGGTLQNLLAESLSKRYPLRGKACITPVPLHFTRQFHRGFNQAEVLARGVAQWSGLSIVKRLRRVRPTGTQTRRRKDERWMAMRGAFSASSPASPSCHPERSAVGAETKDDGLASAQHDTFSCVYLIDDLFTTGATMEECAKALKEAGVERVEGIVLAYG
jgi:competence protein ComFC